MADGGVRQPDRLNSIRRASTVTPKEGTQAYVGTGGLVDARSNPATGDFRQASSSVTKGLSAWDKLKAKQAAQALEKKDGETHVSLVQLAKSVVAVKESTTTYWTAARAGDMRALERLLSKGQDPNELDLNGVSALAWSVVGNHPHITRFLCKRGADPRVCDMHSGRTPLHYCSVRGDKVRPRQGQLHHDQAASHGLTLPAFPSRWIVQMC